MIDLNQIARSHLATSPYQWAAIDQLFAPDDAAALAATFPHDHFKRVADHDGEKKFEYYIRCLVRLGEQVPSRGRRLSDAWRALAGDFLAPGYRSTLSSLIGVDLSGSPMEVNVCHYPPGGSMGAHPDHRDKIVTHVMYFNQSWDDADGGCLTILRSSDPRDIETHVSPVVGNSAIIVRSDDSWHAVSDVSTSCRLSRRSLNATFYRPGSVSNVWPRWDRTILHNYPSRRQGVWSRLTGGTG